MDEVFTCMPFDMVTGGTSVTSRSAPVGCMSCCCIGWTGTDGSGSSSSDRSHPNTSDAACSSSSRTEHRSRPMASRSSTACSSRMSWYMSPTFSSMSWRSSSGGSTSRISISGVGGHF